MDQEHDIFMPFSREQLMPLEERLEILNKSESLTIGLPKESSLQEKRICLTPDAVQVLVANGHEIKVETGAGEASNFSDNEYSEAGAKICYSSQEVFESTVVLKVEPLTEEEIELLKPKTIIISALQPTMLKKSYFEKLEKKLATCFAFEMISDDHGSLPVVRLLGEIAGTTAVLVAAELLSSHQGKGLLIGGVTGLRPTEVLVLGAGTVGENVTRAALGLGATVRVFDFSVTRLRRLQQNIGQRLSTSTMDPKELKKALMRTDVVIGALRSEVRTPTVVTEEMVSQMKEGSIIIDVSIDHGGCFETSQVTTHEKPTFIKHGVVHYGVTNITSRVGRTASRALSNFFLSYLLNVGQKGGFETFIKSDSGVRKGMYMYAGRHCNKILAERFDLKFQDINLLLL